MADSLVTAELLRAFNLFVHDLRGPLSVAHGYLRLLRDERLASPAERERALAQTVDALGRISRLCADASSLVHSYESAPPAGTRVPARMLADQVSQAVQDRVPASGSATFRTPVCCGSRRSTASRERWRRSSRRSPARGRVRIAW